METREFRMIYFYGFKLGYSPDQGGRNIDQGFGERILRWFSKFSLGDKRLENLSSGRHSASIKGEDFKVTCPRSG